jgi:N-acetylglucosaminyldiphosphoundecaprenol N-acetyl-beta-D-mannosaminyltransferase
MNVPTIRVAGVDFHALTLEESISVLLEVSDSGAGGYLVTHNLDHLQAIATNPLLEAQSRSASIRVADGVPLVWASRVQGTPLPGRIAGSDLITALSVEAARHGKSIFLLGGAPGAAEGAAAKLCSIAPSLQVVGTYCPPLGNPDHRERC